MSPRSFPYDVEFSLTSTSSRTPWPASHAASVSTSCGRRDTNEPRKVGIAQKVHRRSQPLASFSAAVGPSPSRIRSGCGPDAGASPAGRSGRDGVGRSAGAIGSSRRRSRGTCDTCASPARIPCSRAEMSS
jgi:hypothetical protein